MTFFLILGSTLWSRTLNYCAYLLVREVPTSSYNPRSIYSLAIELLSVFTFAYSFSTFSTPYLPALWLFFSALFITMHTDTQTMLISRYTTIYLVPIGWACAHFELLPLSPLESITGSFLGLILLWVTAKVSLVLMKTEGLGQGDIDLLAFIGAFTGPVGCWITLLIGSISGALCGVVYMLLTQQRKNIKLPFGTFLSLGALSFLFFKNSLLTFLMS